MKETVSELLQSALAALQAEGTLPADQTFTPQVGNTKDKSHGDYACNIALVAAKAAARDENAQIMLELYPTLILANLPRKSRDAVQETRERCRAFANSPRECEDDKFEMVFAQVVNLRMALQTY